MTKKEKSQRSPLRRILELLRDSLLPARDHNKPSTWRSQPVLPDIARTVGTNDAAGLCTDMSAKVPSLSSLPRAVHPADACMACGGIAPAAMPKAGQQLFVVWDAIGDGRVVGVFADEKLAKELLSVNPFYYRYYRCQFGMPTDDAIGWLDEAGKAQLAGIMNKAIYSSRKQMSS